MPIIIFQNFNLSQLSISGRSIINQVNTDIITENSRRTSLASSITSNATTSTASAVYERRTSNVSSNTNNTSNTNPPITADARNRSN